MTEPLVFVHAADLHLDAPFRRVDAADPRVSEACIDATYAAFERIVDVCIERAASFLVIAGDAYNSADRSFRAQSRFRAAAERLEEAGVRIYLVGGNHDPVTGAGTALEMPGTVHVFPAGEVGRFAFPDEDDPRCVLYGRSYGTARETSNLARGYRRDADDPFAIGVLHANVGGNPGYEPYAPCSLDDLRGAGMDYWALGHIHQYQELHSDPPVIYPGSPQGLDPNEAGGHGCVVVTVGSEGKASCEFVETAVIGWERRQVDLGSAEDADEVLEALRDTCESVREGSGGRPVILRIELDGRSEAHATLARGATLDDIATELREEQMGGSPWIWLDRVTDRTRPALDLDRIREGGDFAADLVRLADEIRSEDAREILEAALDPVSGSVRGLEVDLDPEAVLQRARDLVLDRLLTGEEER